MDRIQEGVLCILRQAEQDLRTLIVQAAEAGDYSGVDLARSVAARVRSIADSSGQDATPDRDGDGQGGTVDASLRVAGTEETATPNTPKLPAKKRGYPRFSVKDHELIKTGWSSKRREEYEHRIGHDGYRRIVAAIRTIAGSGGNLVTAENLLEHTNRAQSTPSYQVYLVLGFLCKVGAISKRGRTGYSVSSNFGQHVEAAWEQAVATSPSP